MLLEGKVIAITGAGRGIGRAMAQLAAQEGAAVAVNDFGVNVDGTSPSDGPAAEVAEEITKAGGRAVANFGSVAEPDGARSIVEQAVAEFGQLDGIVNNAGILRDRMIFNMTEEEWDAVMAVHLRGNFLCTQYAALQMVKQQSGCILGVSSGSGLIGNSGQANYGAAKTAIAGLSMAAARELAPHGVRANAYHIGAQTRMTPGGPQAERAQEVRAAAGIGRERAANRRPNLPEDGVPLPVFLLSDEAADITGRVFAMSGDSVGIYNDIYPSHTALSDEGWTVESIAEYFQTGLGAGITRLPRASED